MHGLDDEQHKALRELVDQHLSGEAQGAGGKGAIDRDDDDIDEDEVEERVREFLRGKGLADDDIEEAIEKVRADRTAARDRLPVPATRGGMGGHLSGRSKDDEADLARKYPGAELVSRDVYGEPLSERRMREADGSRSWSTRRRTFARWRR